VKGEIETPAVYGSLRDRVTFITGGATGVGESLVEHFCAQGARVTFVDLLEPAGTVLVERVKARGHAAPRFIPCDLRDIDALTAAIDDTARQDGPIRVLVNNAGNDDRHRTGEVSVAYWDDRMAVNLRHQFFAVQAARPQMRDAGGGSIINLGSITWLVGDPDSPAYVAAKAAVTGLTRALARELGPERIRVNCVMPGWVMTERQLRLWVTPEGERQMDERQCLRDRVHPADIARMVLFLAADDSRVCTAQNYIVDAGWV
jgi:NAD(P)-dependent dehydrogenase (short-subunit alcohol dehydrogenase family)